MTIVVRLDAFLKQHRIPPRQLALTLQGQVAQASIYALLKPERVKRVDLATLGGVLEALRKMTGLPVRIGDLLEEAEDVSPSLAAALRGRTPPLVEELMGPAFTAHERKTDEAYWQQRQAQRAEELERERERLLR